MKRKVLSIFFALVLVLSLSLVTAVPAGAQVTQREFLDQTRLAAAGNGTAVWVTTLPGDAEVYNGDFAAHMSVPADGDIANIVHMGIQGDSPLLLSQITTVKFWEYLVSAGGSWDGSAAIILFLNEPGTDPPAEGTNPPEWGNVEDGLTFHSYGDAALVNEWSIRDLSNVAQDWQGYADSIGDTTVEPLSYWLDSNNWNRADWEVCFISVCVGAGDWAGYEGYIDDFIVEWTGSDYEDTYLTDPRIVNVTQNTGHNYIQAAIDAANPYDTINVAAGTYPEYLHITTDDLTIEGAGIDQSIIDLDGLIPYWHYSPNRSFASRAGVLITGYGSPDQIIEGVTFKGFTVKNAGLNPPITATGTHDGADDVAMLTDSTATWTPGALVGQWVHNVSDKLIVIDISGNNPIRSYGLITANTATTVTATLAGGLENDWDNGDTYVVMPYEEYVDVAEDLQDDVRGIAIANGKDVSILYCKVINSGYSGITAGYARLVNTHKYSEGVTIDHCIVSDHPSRGISVGNHVGPVTITNNVCSNNKSPHPTDPSRESIGTGIFVSGTKSYGTASGLIAYNTCENNGFLGISLAKHIDGVVVENNTVTGSNFDEDGAGIFFYADKSNPANCQNNTIRNNTVTGNIRGICAYYAQGGTIEGNTITTDSGAFDSGQAAIKIDGGNNITVKDNIISCDGVGIRVTNTWNDVPSYDNTFISNTITGAKFAGVRITKGAYDNTFTGNIITGTTSLTIGTETQGDGVFIDDNAGTGNVFHFNNIHDNADDGMENQTGTPVDADMNYWGDVTGPEHATLNPGAQGDAVSEKVDFSPWLYETQENFVSDAPCYAGSVVLDSIATPVDTTSYAGGWNSFSTPVTLDGSADYISELLALTAGSDLSIVRAQRFDLASQEWVALVMGGELTGDDYPIKPGEGFFIQVSTKGSLPILCSTEPTSPPRTDLVAGWNLVGLSNFEGMTLEDALYNVGYSVVLSASPPNAETWSVPPDPATEEMKLGEAYWLGMGQPGILFGHTTTPVADDMTWELNQN